jgi:phospholipid transport system substrate-binding protein
MTRTPGPLALAIALLSSAATLAANEEVVKPLKTVVGSVRYGRDLAALKLFANEEQGKLLLADDWEKGTVEQRKEFTQLFQVLFAKLCFPKVRKNFENLDSITYDAPAMAGDKADVASVIFINHPLKKQEIKLTYSLINKGGWKVIDVHVKGDDPMLKSIREDQIIPIMKEGGWPHLLELMRAKGKELEAQPLK